MTHAHFVQRWQRSSSLSEFCGTEIPYDVASRRASMLRKMGVPLKYFPRQIEVVDIVYLQQLAKDSLNNDLVLDLA